jgi:hypothetical protein
MRIIKIFFKALKKSFFSRGNVGPLLWALVFTVAFTVLLMFHFSPEALLKVAIQSGIYTEEEATNVKKKQAFPGQGFSLEKVDEDRVHKLYVKKRKVITECIKRATSNRVGSIIYEGRGCGERNSFNKDGKYSYAVDKGVITLMLKVDLRPEGEGGDLIVQKLQSPQQMACVKNFFATQGINLILKYSDYSETPFRQNVNYVGADKNSGAFWNSYDYKDDQIMDDKQTCAFATRRIAIMLGALHGGGGCYAKSEEIGPFFPYIKNNGAMTEIFKQGTSQLYLTDHELKNILSPPLSAGKVCQLDYVKPEDRAARKRLHKKGNSLLLSYYTDDEKEKASLLINSGANIDGKLDHPMYTVKEPLIHTATREGEIDWVEFLLDRGADIDGRGTYGRTPLYWAVIEKNLELTQFLIRRGAHIHVIYDGNWKRGSDRKEETLLHTAALVKSIEIAKLLISNGLSVNYKNGQGETPLFKAIPRSASETEVGKAIEMGKLLIVNGANINAKNQFGETLLFQILSQSASGKEEDRVNEFVEFLKANGARSLKVNPFN